MRNQQEGGKFFTVGEMYFNLPQLQTRLEQIGRVTKDGEKKLQGGAIGLGHDMVAWLLGHLNSTNSSQTGRRAW